MEIKEALEIFDVWRNWFDPCHTILLTAFMSHIPESFLPYSIDVLNEALTIVANIVVSDDKKMAKAIIVTRNCLSFYSDDEEGYHMLSKMLSMPGMVKAMAERVKRNKDYWGPDQLKEIQK